MIRKSGDLPGIKYSYVNHGKVRGHTTVDFFCCQFYKGGR